MSTVTHDPVEREEAEHRLTVAEGLLLALGSGHLALDAARKFLGNTDLSEADCRADLEGATAALRAGLKTKKKRKPKEKPVLEESGTAAWVVGQPHPPATLEDTRPARVAGVERSLEEGVFSGLLHPRTRRGEFRGTVRKKGDKVHVGDVAKGLRAAFGDDNERAREAKTAALNFEDMARGGAWQKSRFVAATLRAHGFEDLASHLREAVEAPPDPASAAVGRAVDTMPTDALEQIQGMFDKLSAGGADPAAVASIGELLKEIAMWAIDHADTIDHLLPMMDGSAGDPAAVQECLQEAAVAGDEGELWAVLEEFSLHLKSRSGGAAGHEFKTQLHPRDRVGEFSEVVAKLKPGEHTKLPGGIEVHHRQSVLDNDRNYYAVRAHGKHFASKDPVKAAARALDASAQSHHPQSLGGPVKYKNLADFEKNHHKNKLHESVAELLEVKSSAYPDLDRSPKANWVEKSGGLPSYIERIAKHIHSEGGRPIGTAIAMAVSTVKRWCAGGGVTKKGAGTSGVSAATKAKACAAVAQWEAKKAKTHMKEAVALAEAATITSERDGVVKTRSPLPPSLNYCEKLLSEVEAAYDDWDAWENGLSPADVKDVERMLDEGELELEEATKLLGRGRHAPWNSKLHPRDRVGKFDDVFDQIFKSKEPVAPPKHSPLDEKYAKAEKSLGVLSDHEPDAAYREAWAGVEGVEDLFVDGKMNAAAAHMAGETLDIDTAIGATLAAFPGLKDWSLDGPKADKGKSYWDLSVVHGSGTSQLRVWDDAKVEDLTAKPKLSVVGAPKAPPAYGFVSAGGPEVVSHMEDFTYFKGADGKTYQKLEDSWHVDKNGKQIKGTDIRNVDSGSEKWAPYFALHGIQYEQLKPADEAGVHPAAAVVHEPAPMDTFAALLKSVSNGKSEDIDYGGGGGGGGGDGSLAGKTVVVTGVIPGYTRPQVQALIAAKGGINHSSVKKNTDILVTGGKVGAVKTNAAAKNGTQVIPWEEFSSHFDIGEARADPLYRVLLTRYELQEAVDTDTVVRLRARQEVLMRRLGPEQRNRLLELDARELLESRDEELEERKFSSAERKKDASAGKALPDGSFPIENADDLKNAMRRLPQAKDVARARRHIAERAASLGLGHLVHAAVTVAKIETMLEEGL